jgi:hypothetical protein
MQRYLISPADVRGAVRKTTSLSGERFGKTLLKAAARCGFKKDAFSGGSYTGSKAERSQHFKSLPTILLMCRWDSKSEGETGTDYELVAYYERQRAGDRFQTAEVVRVLLAELSAEEARRKVPPPPRDPLVGPGERVPSRYDGHAVDFSALGHGDALLPFEQSRHGLWIGRSAFGWPPGVRYGAPLRLPRVPGRIAAEEYGVLLCAPQGAGKTHLLIKWATEAAEQGRNVFVVDVKGNMRPLLERAMRQRNVRARILQFTTDPHQPKDSINVLQGLSARDPDAILRFNRLASALLPEDEYKGRGEELFRHQFAVRAIHGAIMLLKLMESMGMLGGRAADLTDLYELIVSEERLLSKIEAVARKGHDHRAVYDLDDCVTRLRTLLRSDDDEDGRRARDKRSGGIVIEGQRPSRYTYDEYVIPLLMALEPFEPSSPLAKVVSSFGEGKTIPLHLLGRDGPPRIVILSAREEDSQIAVSFLSIVMRRLRDALETRRHLAPEKRGEILLLLDETARIKGFNAQDFITVARDMKVGYALVYQSLAKIGLPDAIDIVLDNIGVKIFLQQLKGNDLKLLNDHLPPREVPRITESSGEVDGQVSGKTFTQSLRLVPFLPSVAPRHLPAGRRPALVYAQNHQVVFLVDLYDESH